VRSLWEPFGGQDLLWMADDHHRQTVSDASLWSDTLYDGSRVAYVTRMRTHTWGEDRRAPASCARLQRSYPSGGRWTSLVARSTAWTHIEHHRACGPGPRTHDGCSRSRAAARREIGVVLLCPWPEAPRRPGEPTTY